MKPYVVHTRYVSPGGALIVHTDGPFTYGKARRMREQILALARGQGLAGQVDAHACQLLDPSASSPFTLEYRR